MAHWYQNGRYKLITNREYSVTRSYNAMLIDLTKLQDADLIWTKAMLPKAQIYSMACIPRQTSYEGEITKTAYTS